MLSTSAPATSTVDRPLTVGLFCDSASRGGVFTYTRQLAQALGEQGLAVHVLTLAPGDEAARQNLADLEAAAERVDCLSQRATPGERTAQIRRHLAQAPWDVFVPNYRYTTYAACAAQDRQRRAKLVGVCHNDHDSYYDLLGYYQATIDALVGPSQTTCRQLQQRLPQRAADVVYLPHGVDVPGGPAPTFAGGTLRLAYHGRLEEEQKSVSSLIELAAELQRRGVDFHLTLIGGAAEGLDYAQLARDRGVGDRVTIQGPLGREPLFALLRQQHLAVLTSRYEGFCLGLAEALAVGLPAVAFGSGGVIEEFLIPGQNGMLVPWGEVGLMAQWIERLALDPPQWQALSSGAQATAEERFSLSAFGARYRAFLEELVQRPAVHAWPRLRPVLAEPSEGGLARVVDRLGSRLHLWS